MRTLFIVTIIMGCSLMLSAQDYTAYFSNKRTQHLSLQWLGWTFHPGGGAVNMVKNYPLKLDNKAYFVLNVGAVVKYDIELSEKWSIRTEGGYYKDCAYLDAGYIHASIRWTPFEFGRHSFSIDAGPVFTVREDWHRYDGYKDTDIYGKRVWKGMQYRLFPVAGELEYAYKFNNKFSVLYSVIPAYPAVLTSMIGVRMKL